MNFVLLGEIIREERHLDGRSQLEFSLDANLSRAFYGRLELGEHEISLTTLYKICRTLNVSMSKIIDKYELLVESINENIKL